jgi:hypothetical protein
LRNPHTAWAWRFVQRFRAFQPINQPKMLVYDDFVEIVGEEEVGEQGAPQLVYNILSAAGACFKEAKLLFDAARKVTTTHGVDGIHTPCEVYAIQDAPTLLKVAVTNAVHCMQLSMIVKKQLEDVHGQQFPPTPPDEKIKQQFLVVDNKLHVHFPVLKLV